MLITKCDPQKAYVSGFSRIATPRMQIPKMQPPEGIRVGIFTNRNPQNANTQNATPRKHTCRDFHESQPPEFKYPKCDPQKAYVSGFSRIATPRMQIPKMRPPEGIRVGIFTNRNPQNANTQLRPPEGIRDGIFTNRNSQNANTQNATPRRHTCRDFHESQPPECKYPKCDTQKAYVSGFFTNRNPQKIFDIFEKIGIFRKLRPKFHFFSTIIPKSKCWKI